MLVATTQLVTSPFIVIVLSGAPQFVQVLLLEGSWACITHHGVPFRYDTCIFDALEMRGGTIVMGVVNAEAPPTVLPQGAVPFSMVGLFIAALETVGEGGALSFPFDLVSGYGTQLEAVFSFDIAPLIFRWPLCCVDAREKG